MNKYGFIKNLLETEKFNTSQKDRLLKLVSKELNISENLDQKVLDDIELIKRKIGLIRVDGLDNTNQTGVIMPPTEDDFTGLVESKTKMDKPKAQKIKLPIIHNPKELVQILSRFSDNGSALKYATHSWEIAKDEGLFQNLDDFLKKARSEWNKFEVELKKLKPQLWAKMLTFLFNSKVSKNGWGTYRIKFGWSSPELKTAIENQDSINPESVVIPELLRTQIDTLNGNITIQNFGQVVKVFKNEIEIRDEDNFLEDLVIKLHDDYLGTDFRIKNIEGLRRTNFYADVDYLRKGLKLILDGIKKRPAHPEISYILDDDKEHCIVKIIHHDSNPIDKSIYDSKFGLEKGDFGSIKDSLMNLCDWSIESEFREGVYRLNFLTSDPNTPFSQKMSAESEGFKHILKFYKI